MSDYLDKIQTQKKDGTPLATVPFRDSEAREDITTIQNELTTDTTTIEGNPLNFSTLSAQNAKSTILSCEPIQDLHGYDKPWVGGAGKNKLPLVISTIKTVNTAGTWNDNVFTHNNGGKFTILTDNDNNVIGIKLSDTFSAESNFTLTTTGDLGFNGYILNGGQTNEVSIFAYDDTVSQSAMDSSGVGVTIPDTFHNYRIVIRSKQKQYSTPITCLPMIRLSTETDSSFAPYTNICPISGRTEIGILGCGKNLLEAIESGAVDDHGVESDNNLRCRCNDYIEVKPNEKYTFSATTTQSKTLQCYIRYFADNLDSYNIGNSGWKSASTYTFTTPNDCNYLKIILRFSDDSSISTTYITDAQLEQGETPTQYTTYTKSNDLTISLGQPVYGGQLDVENGVLVVKDKIEDFGNLNYGYDSVNTRFTTNISDMKYNATLPRVIQFNSSCYNCVHDGRAISQIVNGDAYIGAGSPSLYIHDYRYDGATLNDFKTAITGQKICYPLATPITIQLTPNEISLLEGVNNISTTGDKITLTYRDGKVATLGDLTSAVDSLDGKIEDSKILTDTVTGDKYILVVSNGVLDIQQVSN